MTSKEKRWTGKTMDSIKELYGKLPKQPEFKPGTEPKGIKTPPKPDTAPRIDDNA